jgi:hypothetical protein
MVPAEEPNNASTQINVDAAANRARRGEAVLNGVRLLAITFTALAMAAGCAHLLELPNKIRLPREAYLTVQQIYRGWALLGIVVTAALVSTLILAIMVRHERRMFIGAIVALSCLVGTQIIFWVFTYPVNRTTKNWTVVPENWQALRDRWEYSHAAAACLDFAALLSLVVSSLSRSH